MKKVNVLECTLRDGSYAIDFQFTSADTFLLSRALIDIGFKNIEIGHGLGFSAYEKGKGISAETDEDYLKAVLPLEKEAHFFMFFIPGIADISDINLAYRYKLYGLRVGTNIFEVKLAQKYIEAAKNKGFFVCSNLMKSYAVDYKEFVKYASLAVKYGADIVYLVDSAGGMLPSEVSSYIKAFKDKFPEKEIGFHGHNNLELVHANVLEAVKSGASWVDTTLKGMGRSSGNPRTEVMIPLLKKSGYQLNDINELDLLAISNNVFSNLIDYKNEFKSEDLLFGLAKFHSSFYPLVKKIASQYEIDEKRIIIELDKQKIYSPSEGEIKQIAQNLREKENQRERRLRKNYYSLNNFLKTGKEYYKEYIKDLKAVSAKKFSRSVLVFSYPYDRTKKDIYYSYFREILGYLIGVIELERREDFENIYNYSSSIIDYVLINYNDFLKWELSKDILSDKVILFDEFTALWQTILLEIYLKDDSCKKVYFSSDDKLFELTKMRLGESQPLFLLQGSENKITDSLIFVNSSYCLSENFENCRIIYLSPCFLEEDISSAIREKNQILKLDFNSFFLANIIASLKHYELMKKRGEKVINGVKIGAGGVVLEKGGVIVDDIEYIRKIYGVVDGKGEFLSLEKLKKYKSVFQKLEDYLYQRE